jgi:hypothetical protein
MPRFPIGAAALVAAANILGAHPGLAGTQGYNNKKLQVTTQVTITEGVMNVRLLFFAMAMIATAAFVTAPPANAADKPNIVVIMGDDIGMWNIGAYTAA